MSDKFHKLTMGGGPHAHGLEVFLDGMPLKGVTSLSLTANYHDAVRVTLELIVEVLPSQVMAATKVDLPLNIEELPPHIQQIASDLVALVEKEGT